MTGKRGAFMQARCIVWRWLTVILLLGSLTACSVAAPPPREVPPPDQIVVHFDRGQTLTLKPSDAAFTPLFEGAAKSVLSAERQLPLAALGGAVADVKAQSTYVELVYATPPRLSTRVTIPRAERDQYRVGETIDASGRRLLQPRVLTVFMTIARRGVVIAEEAPAGEVSAWQATDVETLDEALQKLGP